MYTVTVCDDCPEETGRIARLVKEYFTDKRLEFEVLEYLNAQTVIDAINSGKLSDVYVLDIIMPDISGMELAKYIRKTSKSCSIIFATSTIDYAISGYKVNAQDYILKPIQRCELFAAFDKLLERISKIGTIVVRIKNINGYKELATDMIMNVESRMHSVTFFLSDGNSVVVKGSIEQYAPNLMRYSFFLRCHKSFIVNLNFVKELRNNVFVLNNGRLIPVSRSNLAKCRDYYHGYIFEKMNGNYSYFAL